VYDCDTLVSVDVAFEQAMRKSAYRRVISITTSLGPGRNMESEMEPWKIVNFSRGVPRHLSRGETEIHFRTVASDES